MLQGQYAQADGDSYGEQNRVDAKGNLPDPEDHYRYRQEDEGDSPARKESEDVGGWGEELREDQQVPHPD